MKALLSMLAVVVSTLGLGCMDQTMMPDTPSDTLTYNSGTVEYCNVEGCYEITGTYYYDASGMVVYWDPYYNCWVGPHGYWTHGMFVVGFPAGFHSRYRSMYHAPHYGGGYHGGYHGGGYHGGHSGGGHSGGHHR